MGGGGVDMNVLIRDTLLTYQLVEQSIVITKVIIFMR